MGNKSRCPPNSDCSVEQPGWGLTNTGDFQNVHAPFYWFGLENAANPTEAWLFVTNDGGQGPGDKTHPGGLDNGGKPFPSYALAVRPGDVCSTHNPKHC